MRGLVVALAVFGVSLSQPAEAGIRKARAAALQSPLDPDAWVALGDAHRKWGRRARAADAYERALSLAPEDPEITRRLAEVGPGSVARRLERRALRNPLDDELWGDLGDAWLERGRSDRALEYYLYALRVDPADSEWRTRVLELGGGDRLVQELEQVVAAGRADDELIGDLSDVLYVAGDHDAACDGWSRALRMDPSDSEWAEKVATRCGVGGTAPVIPHDAPTIGMNTLSVEPYTHAAARLADGDVEGALSIYEAHLSRDPSADSLALYGVVALGGVTKVDVLERLTGEHPTDDELWGDLGDAYLGTGAPERAEEAYRRARELDPGDDEWSDKLFLLRSRPPSAPDGSDTP